MWPALAEAARQVADAVGLTEADRRGLADLVPLLAEEPPVRSGSEPVEPVEPVAPVAPRGTAATSHRSDPVSAIEPADPGSLGRLHQSLLGAEHRHERGVHYTPSLVAARLVARALRGWTGGGQDVAVPVVCDPSCGGGVFLLAAAGHLEARGVDPVEAIAALHGIDLDPVAVEVTRTALVLHAAALDVRGERLRTVAELVVAQVVEGDALHGTWPAEGHLDAVVGNPPFGGQLARTTARDRAGATAARDLLGGSAAGYADTAGLFLVRSVAASAAGGRVVLLQPLSFLGARDAGAVRRRLEEQAVLEEVWLAGERLFGAAVDVCAPVLRVAGPLASPEPDGPVRVSTGGPVDAGGSAPSGSGDRSEVAGSVGHRTQALGAAEATVDARDRRAQRPREAIGTAQGETVVEVDRARLARAGSWAPVVAAATGVPAVDLHADETLGGRARATAGFRDEFYALVPFVADLAQAVESDNEPVLPALPVGMARLVTSGLVEPARTLWGRRTTRLAGRRLQAPAVDVVALRAWATGPDGDRRLAAWADARLRPKVVVATQTKVVEAAVDDDGTWWPSVPVISVVLDPDHDDREGRWLVAAALSAPPVSAWAAERAGGTALAPQALKLSARQVAEVPLPVDREAWAEGARLLQGVGLALDDDERARRLLAAGRVLTAAHGLDPVVAGEVLRWWAGRAGCDREI